MSDMFQEEAGLIIRSLGSLALVGVRLLCLFASRRKGLTPPWLGGAVLF